MHVMLAISFLLLPLGAVWAQEKTKEQQPKPPSTPKQYKRVHQRILKPLLGGKVVRARNILDAAVKRDPLDPETWFLKTIVDAAGGKVEDALAAMSRALELKLPPERFLAGPRKLFAPIAKTKLFEMLEARFAHRPVHGPMLGDLTGKSVKVWLRTAKACKVEVLVHPKGDGKSKPIFGHAATTAASDFTTVVQVNGLTPKTEYEYSLRIDGGDPVKGGAFKSFAKKGDMCQLRVAFGGGSGYVPEHERMWDTIRSFKPDMIMLLGDNVYIDAPKHRELQRYCYYRRQSRPEFRRLVANIPVYSIWDDHDFGTNDCFHGAEIDNNPTPGNKEGGLTTIYEKSLGAIAKGGTSPLTAVYEFAEPMTEPGFVVMDTPGYDPVSVTGMVAGGANVVLFTTGRGSVFGFKPVPSIKIATNSRLYHHMIDDMDINAGDAVEGGSVQDVGMAIFEDVIAVASGKQTKSEIAGVGELEFCPWVLGPIL